MVIISHMCKKSSFITIILFCIADVRLLAEQSPGLVELDVSDCTQLTAASVSTIISELRHTEYLAFSRCYTIQPDAYL